MAVGVVGGYLIKQISHLVGQGKMKQVRENSGNFDMSGLWQPWSSNTYKTHPCTVRIISFL